MSDAPGADAVYALERPHKNLMWLYVLRALLTGPGFAIAILPMLFKFKTLRYRFDTEGVTMAWGILWRKEIFLTYSRIQDIHISRGLLERWFGMATIHVETASGSASAEMSIVGLREYELVRDHLYSKMRGARYGETDESEADTDPEANPAALLAEIRDELRHIRQRLEGRE